MAVRPVFRALTRPPYFEETDTEFTFYSGFALARKQASVRSLHENYLALCPDDRILEISTKSEEELGRRLSAFSLMFGSEIYGGSFHLENVFQSSKVFENGGPYRDLLYVSPKDAKRDERLSSSGRLTGFSYGDVKWPLEPKTCFYDWLYMTALSRDEELSDRIMEFDAFTDIEFNPKRSVNCQARSAAIYVGLKRAGLLEKALSGPSEMTGIYMK